MTTPIQPPRPPEAPSAPTAPSSAQAAPPPPGTATPPPPTAPISPPWGRRVWRRLRSIPSEAWLSAAGIGLLLAAAGTFLATRWAEMTIDAKLVVLVLATLAAAAVARRVQDRLPLTAEALVHLAWGLLVVDVAAAAVRSGTTTSTATALAAGAAAIGAIGLLQRSSWLAPVVMAGAVPTTLLATGTSVGAAWSDVGWVGLGLAVLAWLGLELAAGGSAVRIEQTQRRLGSLPTLTAAGGVVGLLGGTFVAGVATTAGLLATPDPVAAVAVAVGGLLLAASSVRRARSLGTVAGVGLAVLGQWWWALLVGIDAVDAWLAPTAIAALVWMTFRLQRDPDRELDTSDRTVWALASIGAVAGSLLERADGQPIGHVVAGVSIAVGLVLVGGLLRLGAPLFVGLTTLALFPVIELVLGEITIATWMWMGLAGLLLAAGGAALEHLGTSPTAAGRELHRRYRTTFR